LKKLRIKIDMNCGEKIIYDAIDEILWVYWDPVGINDFETARDEYRSYIPHILQLKMQGADELKIARYLYELAWENIGMRSDMEHCKVVAHKIAEI